LKGLSDQELLGGLRAAAGLSREADAELIRFIAEVDARKLFREQACPSMFSYCVERLGMSEPTASRRIRVARVARECPEVLGALASGRVHLAGLALLAPHVRRDNIGALLVRAAGKSKRAIESLGKARGRRLPRARRKCLISHRPRGMWTHVRPGCSRFRRLASTLASRPVSP
jgi:hypothetical protein